MSASKVSGWYKRFESVSASRQAVSEAASKLMPQWACQANISLSMATRRRREHTDEAFGVLGLVPASVELRADATVPTRLLSRLLACLLFARSRALQQVYMTHGRKIHTPLSKTSTTCILAWVSSMCQL